MNGWEGITEGVAETMAGTHTKMNFAMFGRVAPLAKCHLLAPSVPFILNTDLYLYNQGNFIQCVWLGG